MMLDRFRLALAIVDALGVIAFFLTFNPVILIYLLIFNILAILTDTLRRGLVVHKRGEPTDLPDQIPVNPVTGNRVLFQAEQRTEPERRNEVFQAEKRSEPPSAEREEMEKILKDWVT